MSYCVNCGVELDDSAKSCALCDTPVNNPKKPEPEPVAPFSDIPMVPENMRSKYAASIISVIMLIPNIVCSIVNVFVASQGLWSVYVNCTSMLIWVVFVFPFLTKKTRPILMWAFDTVACAVYVYVFYAMQSANTLWYFILALPIIACLSLCVLVFMLWGRKKKRHWTAVLIHIFTDICIMSILVFLLMAYAGSQTGMVVCLIVLLSALSLIGFYIYCNRSRRMRAWLSKKFFF